ncbi:MAG: class I SAM-dependent methyltransferase [Clostridium sp.]|nr:class I SAM-dependent methyltransferase [Clostridium sp.]
MIPELSELDQSFFDRVASLANSDLNRELLRAGTDPVGRFAVLQAECRRKCRTKIPSLLDDRRFLFPNSLASEQATGERIARWHATIAGGGRVFDATSGLGVDSMALARVSESVVAFDLQEDVARVLDYNACSAGIRNLDARCGDSIGWLKEHPDERFDTIFVDPARRGDGGGRLFALSDCRPDVVAELPLLLDRARRVCIKASPMLDITSTLRELRQVTAIYSVGTETECKELFVVVDRDCPESTVPKVAAVTFRNDGTESVVGLASCEQQDDSAPEPAVGGYIVEPYPSVMKLGGAVDCRGARRIARNTHLYLTDNTVSDFGRIYRVVDLSGFGKRDVKSLLSRRGNRFNVSCRNFPMTAPQLVSRLKIREGGDKRLFALTDGRGERLLVVAESAQSSL